MLQVEIRVEGCLDERWSEWLDGLTIAHTEGGPDRSGGETVLTGSLVDQAALYGLIGKLRDLGLSLLSVQRTLHGDTLSPHTAGQTKIRETGS
jgi:hypothetical protein